MLTVDNLHAYYGPSHVLQGVSLNVGAGEAVSLLGRNGAGKTTALLTIMGYLKPAPGEIRYRGTSIAGLPPYRISNRGVGYVPQERGIFKSLTVRENLGVAARAGDRQVFCLDDVFETFPRLKEREKARGSQLSGGEQQMLSIARALLLNPSLLILDEPSEGLAPLIVREIIDVLRRIKNMGVSILMVEQNIHVAFAIADRHYILNKGCICFEGGTEDIQGNRELLHQFLGI